MGERQAQVAGESAERRHDRSTGLFAALSVHHAVHDQQQSESGAGQRGDEERGVDQISHQEHPRDPHCERYPSNVRPDVAAAWSVGGMA